jgi:TRAP transporter TAXI family solute receptor
VLDFLKVYGPITLLIAAGFLVAFQFVDPAPPRSLTFATGSEQGAYHAFGERYRDILARDGIEVILRPTGGSVENLELLRQKNGAGEDAPAVDVAFLQSGIGKAEEAPELVSLAALYFEPLWVFVRGDQAPVRLNELAGRRLAVGADGSGTNAVTLELLAANGLGPDDGLGTELVEVGGADAAKALLAGDLDAAFFVTARLDSYLANLLESRDLQLMSFARAKAYEKRFSQLSAVLLPEGVLDLAANRPDKAITLLSPTAGLVAHEDLHPALVDLLMAAASEIHGKRGLFAEAGEFPSPRNLDFPLSAESKRYFESGLGFLRRVLPFWAATLIERAWILILPILTLLIPLLKIAPPTYRWQVRRRIYRWYQDLRRLENSLEAARASTDGAALEEGLNGLQRLQKEVSQVVVPLSYADNLYHLRQHIDFVRNRFTRR